MLKNKILCGLVSIVLATGLYAEEQKQIDYEYQMIQKVIPKSKIAKYKKSVIEGFYNVYFENGQIVYVNPFKNLILFGEIWNSTGSSLTATEREQWQKEIGSDGNIQSPEDRVIAELKKTDDENKKWNIELVKILIIQHIDTIQMKVKQKEYIKKNMESVSQIKNFKNKAI